MIERRRRSLTNPLGKLHYKKNMDQLLMALSDYPILGVIVVGLVAAIYIALQQEERK